MIVTGASVEDVAVIVRAVSATRYNGNVEIRDISDKSSSRTVRTSFTLRVKDGHAGSPGAKGSRGYDSSGTGPHGLRCSSLVACWHVHYDVLRAIFTHHPDATVTTMFYRATADTFHRNAINSAAINVGSQLDPTYSPELCECTHHTDDEVAANYGGHTVARARVTALGMNGGEPTAYAREQVRNMRYDPRAHSELGKYASDGAYEAELTRCSDCGCTS